MKKILAALLLSAALLISSCSAVSNLNTPSAINITSPVLLATTDTRPATTATTASMTTQPTKIPSTESYSLVVEPAAGIAPVLNMIEGAKRSIDLVMYELYDQQIENALISAESHGIAVRVLLNEGENGAAPSSETQSAYNTFQAGGVPVHWAPSYFALTHQKTLIVDGDSALIMTFNLTPEYYSTSRDFGIIDNDQTDVSAIETTFGYDWQGTQNNSPAGDDLFWSPGAEATILAAIDNSKTSLYVENEEMSDSAVVNALAATAKRGVNVEVVMTESSEWDANFAILRAAGVGIRTYPDNSTSLYIHAKIIVVDGTSALVGSQNFSSASLDDNRELGIILTDPGIISSLSSTFQSDWNGGTQITGGTTTSSTVASTGAAFPLQVVSVTSPVAPGSNATLTILTEPNAQCTITVNYKSGPSSASGLGAKTADSQGNVSWTWNVGKSTTAGTWQIVVTATYQGNTVTSTANFMVS